MLPIARSGQSVRGLQEGTEHLTGMEAAVVKNLRACKELAGKQPKADAHRLFV